MDKAQCDSCGKDFEVGEDIIHSLRVDEYLSSHFVLRHCNDCFDKVMTALAPYFAHFTAPAYTDVKVKDAQ